MVFTVRLILVVTLLLTTCAAQRRSYRRSIPKESDAARNTTTPILNDGENATSPTSSRNDEDPEVTEDATPESKPKTETSSEKYNYTNAARKTKSRGNARYFTTTIANAKISSEPSTTEKSETQLQYNTDKKPAKHAKEIGEEEKVENTLLNTNKSVKVPRRPEKPHQLVPDDEKDTAESVENVQANVSKVTRKLKKPENLIQDENGGTKDAKSVAPTTKKSGNNEPTLQLNVEASSNVIATQSAKEIDGEEKPESSNETSEGPKNENDDATENTQTTKRNATSRSLSIDIEKYVSPEFHNNKNNFYTSPLFLPDSKKYMSFGKDFTSSIKSTNPFEINTELTTPRNHFFDSKFQAVKEDVAESLKEIDESFKRGRDVETTETVAKEEVTNSGKFNDTKGEVEYKKFLRLEASESKTRNRIHKDYLAEKGVRMDMVSNYSDTKIIDDDGISEGLNKIPVTGVGAQYKEEGPQKLPDMENQESKKVVAENPYGEAPTKTPPNKTDADAEISALTNKIETEYAKSTQSVLAVNIDPITADTDYERNSKGNAINIFKRGSTKTTDTQPTKFPETTSIKPDENELVVNNKSTVTPITADSDYERNSKGNAINFFEGGSTKETDVATSVKPNENELCINKSALISAKTDPHYEKKSRGNAIDVFERGSTKKTDATFPETTSAKPDVDELVIKKSTVTPVTADSDYEEASKVNAINTSKRGERNENESAANKSTTTTPSLNVNRRENIVISTFKNIQAKLSMPENIGATSASLTFLEKEARENENAINAFEKEPSEDYGKDEKSRADFDGAKERSPNQVTTQRDVTTRSPTSSSTRPNLSWETTLEYPRSTEIKLMSAVKRGSTKIAEVDVDHEYFEGVTVTPITMKPRKLSTVTEEQPNEILPVEMVSEKKVVPTSASKTSIEITETTSNKGEGTELTSAFSIITEISSTESPITTVNSESDSPEEDFTEDLQTVTESIEIFNVSYSSTIVTETDEVLTSTLPYSTEQFPVGDNTSYYAASDDDSTVMYEVTTIGIANSSLDVSFESNLDLDDTDNKPDQGEDVPEINSTSVDVNRSFKDTIKQNEISGEEDGKKVVPLNTSTSSESPNNGISRDIHEMEEDLNPDDADDDYVEGPNRKVNQSDMGDLEVEGEHVAVMKANTSEVVGTSTQGSTSTANTIINGVEEATAQTTKAITETNNTIIKLLPDDEEDLEATTTDILGLTGPVDEDNSGKIAAIVISSVGAVCLFLLAGLLIVMRKRQKRFNYGQRCRPVSLDAYSMDNVSICNTVGRRKGVLRTSKRSYGNPAFDDPATVSHPLNFFGLTKFAGNLEDVKAEFEEIPQVTTRTNELPEGCDVKNRYANVIPLPETRVYLNYIDGYPNSDYINANYVRGAKSVRHYYIACQAPMQNTIDDFWRMVWEQQTKVILMLTSLFESGIEKCADYLPPSEVLDCHRLFGDFQVTLKKREVKDKYIISNLQLKNMVSNSWREITHLWYLEWPDKGVPEEANSVIAFLIEARSYMKTGNVPDNKTPDGTDGNDPAAFELSPVVVHCSPGTGRTGTVIGCDIAIREFELSRQVDIPKIVYKIRRDRASSVQTKEQYAFIYKVINLYATKLTGGALDSI